MRNDFKFTHEVRDGVIVNVFFDFDIKTATKKRCELTLDVDSLVLLGEGDIPVVGLTRDEFKALQSKIISFRPNTIMLAALARRLFNF